MIASMVLENCFEILEFKNGKQSVSADQEIMLFKFASNTQEEDT